MTTLKRIAFILIAMSVFGTSSYADDKKSCEVELTAMQRGISSTLLIYVGLLGEIPAVVGETLRLDLITLGNTLNLDTGEAFDLNRDPFKLTKMGWDMTTTGFDIAFSGKYSKDCSESEIRAFKSELERQKSEQPSIHENNISRIRAAEVKADWKEFQEEDREEDEYTNLVLSEG